MSKEQDGGPAFPRPPAWSPHENPECTQSQEGMTLRDWFAGQEKIEEAYTPDWPLLGALAGPKPKGTWNDNHLEWFVWENRWRAAIKYARADAMLEARKK